MAAPQGNKNAEKWTEEEAKKLLLKCIDLSYKDDTLDFIGTVYKQVQSTRGVVDHLIRRFPELKHLGEIIKCNCESNCYENGKKSKINPSMAIMNLKSNHGWTDRLDNTSKDEKIEQVTIFKLPDNGRDD